ncbi:zinc finger and BTB domain-containing protein 49-like isoform X1 [Portunus trituberculatus]|uniref:zinc finger and BTB domain-containing protein 49-like isoform X1 n=1 Tax=Portunus trituberculatus TaxID=210409 RepID=UPI001E1D02B3|nr:zinc finger and BTB domain-containing protein 49-like isoform X1 [Portunus trituberculatus]XP_045123766.1 zinc finger and BTB domain-containing protein 49-like isoform X1 [Portunus trituberculatus]
MAVDGLLSLRWNNHSSSFLKQLSFLRDKETYSDLTLVCGGQFYQVHRLVVSGCSEYFRAILEHTPCRHPAVVLQDLPPRHLEALLSYMYLGQVSVPQDDLGGLIKAAECLAIKGLAVPDEPTSPSQQESHTRPTATTEEGPPNPKRRRHDREASSPASTPQGDDSATEDHSEARERGRGSTGSSPQPATSSFPSQQQHTLMEGRTVFTVKEEREDEVKCEDNILGLTDLGGGLSGAEEASQGEDSQNTFRTVISGGDGGGSSVLPQYPAQPQSFKEVVAQALPPTSGMDGDASHGWEGSQGKGELMQGFHLDTFSPQQDTLPQTHHTSLHQREPSMAMRLQGRAAQEDNTSPPAVLPFPLLSCTALGDREAETAGRPWREWRCSYPDCGYVTDRESWLRQHVRKHTGEKPFACPLCTFRSAQKGNVNVHIRRVHYGGVMPVSSEPPPAATTSVAASSPTASAGAAAAPKVNMQWFMKSKVQGTEFSKSQNGVCQ